MVIPWDENYSVEIRSIDEQHKKLFSYFNQLHDAIYNNDFKKKMGDILDGLVDYTHTHLTYEENLLYESQYPEYEEHKRQHDYLTNKVSEIQQRIQDGLDITIIIETMKFVTNWLTQHILIEDKKYSSFLLSKGVK